MRIKGKVFKGSNLQDSYLSYFLFFIILIIHTLTFIYLIINNYNKIVKSQFIIIFIFLIDFEI